MKKKYVWLFLLLLAAAYAAERGEETVLRSGAILFFFLTAVEAVILGFSAVQVRAAWLAPQTGRVPFAAMTAALSPMAVLYVRGGARRTGGWLAAGIGLCAAAALCAAGTLSPRVAGEEAFAVYTMAKSVSVFGVMERLDCLDWVEWARGRFGARTPIVLVGISMGAATVLMAAGLELPENVRGILADCGYTAPSDIIRSVMASMHCPRAIYPLLRLGGRLYGGFDIDSAGAEEALRRCRVPVLFVHGEDDRFVPCDMSRRNWAACASEKTLLTVPGAGHGLSYLVDEPGYEAALEEFFERLHLPARVNA